MKIPPIILRYWLAMNASAFDSAAHSLATFCGVAGVHEACASIPALRLSHLAALFGVMFGRAVLAYLAAHPVSELAGDDPSSVAILRREEVTRLKLKNGKSRTSESLLSAECGVRSAELGKALEAGASHSALRTPNSALGQSLLTSAPTKFGAPDLGQADDGAHGVTRPTSDGGAPHSALETPHS